MMQSVIQLAAHLKTSLHSPANAVELKALERALGYPLPEQVRALYTTTNGLTFNAREGYPQPRLMTVEAVTEFLRVSEWDKRYFPLTANDDSNHYCVRCDEALMGYVVYVDHEDLPTIKFRDVDTFMKALQKYYHDGFTYPQEGLYDTNDPEAADQHDVHFDRMNIHGVPSQFLQPERTPHDLAAARRLITSVHETFRPDNRTHRYEMYLALWLLNDAEEIAALSRYVRMDFLIERLQSLPASHAQSTITQLTARLDMFTEQCAEKLRQFGLNVWNKFSFPGDIRLEAGSKHLRYPYSMADLYFWSHWYTSEAELDQLILQRIMSVERRSD